MSFCCIRRRWYLNNSCNCSYISFFFIRCTWFYVKSVKSFSLYFNTKKSEFQSRKLSLTYNQHQADGKEQRLQCLITIFKEYRWNLHFKWKSLLWSLLSQRFNWWPPDIYYCKCSFRDKCMFFLQNRATMIGFFAWVIDLVRFANTIYLYMMLKLA